eukprot:m51a1_g6315 hypothetical protein (548) ;mRNA; f:335989-337706
MSPASAALLPLLLLLAASARAVDTDCLQARALSVPGVANATLWTGGRLWLVHYNPTGTDRPVRLTAAPLPSAVPLSLDVLSACDAPEPAALVASARGPAPEVVFSAWAHGSVLVRLSAAAAPGTPVLLTAAALDLEEAPCAVPARERQGAWATVEAPRGTWLAAHTCTRATRFASSVEVYSACCDPAASAGAPECSGGFASPSSSSSSSDSSAGSPSSSSSSYVAPGACVAPEASHACRNGRLVRWRSEGGAYHVYVTGATAHAAGDYGLAVAPSPSGPLAQHLSCAGALEVPSAEGRAESAGDELAEHAAVSDGSCAAQAAGTWFLLPARPRDAGSEQGTDGTPVTARGSCGSGPAPAVLVYAECSAAGAATGCVRAGNETGFARWFAPHAHAFWLLVAGCGASRASLGVTRDGACRGNFTTEAESAAGGWTPAPEPPPAAQSSAEQWWPWPSVDWTPLRVIGALAVVACLAGLAAAGVALCVSRRRARLRSVPAGHVELLPVSFADGADGDDYYAGADVTGVALVRRGPAVPALHITGGPRFVIE